MLEMLNHKLNVVESDPRDRTYGDAATKGLP